MATTPSFSALSLNLFPDRHHHHHRRRRRHHQQQQQQGEQGPKRRLLLLGLAPEVLLIIISHLPWPDLLALRHTHPYFYRNISTTVRQRVAWLLSRRPCGLGLPQGRVNMKTDADFCGSREIRAFLERRRWHLDCHGGKEGKHCLVVEGHPCPAKVTSVARAFKVMTIRKRMLWLGRGTLSLPCPLVMSWLLVLTVAVLVALSLSTGLPATIQIICSDASQ